MKFFLVIVTIIFALGCGVAPVEHRSVTTDGSYYTSDISYFKDKQTGLCFAERSIVDYKGYSFTEIPCDKMPRQSKSINSAHFDENIGKCFDIVKSKGFVYAEVPCKTEEL